MGVLLRYFFAVYAILIFLGCSFDPNEPRIDLSQYHLEPGFQLSVVASEPLIQSPVCLTFDAAGRLWVVEMPGYMPNLAGDGEDAPTGRILILEDKDGNGRMDQARVFLDSLVLPRALALVYNGLLYAEPPNLWFVDIQNDQPGAKVLVDSVFAVGGNVEHQPNGLLYHLDNWIYCAKSPFRYRRKNGIWIKEPTAFRGQWGISNDNLGRLYFNDNSNQLAGDFTLPEVLSHHPGYRPEFGAGVQLTRDQRLYPLHASAINRGYQPGALDSTGKVVNFTSACGPLVYRGGQFPGDYHQNVFVCAPEANLVKRNTLSENQGRISARQAWQGKEFLASTDEAFRPVNLYTGPDGGMYIVDFHHGIIQHKTYMTAYLREQILQRGLDSVFGQGRILKVLSNAKPPVKMPRLTTATPEEWVDLFDHENAWVREKARELVVFKGRLPANLKTRARQSDRPLGQILALWALEGLGVLDAPTLAAAAQSRDEQVRATVAVLSVLAGAETEFLPLLEKLAGEGNPPVNWHAAFSIGRISEKNPEPAFSILRELIQKHPQDTILAEAVISGLGGRENNWLSGLDTSRLRGSAIIRLVKNITDLKKALPEQVVSTGKKDNLTQGLLLYRQHCSGCHGMNGEGLPALAPPLDRSDYVLGNSDNLVKIALFGLTGPITINGKRYEFNAGMPGLAGNPDLSDPQIAAILNFVQNAFGDGRQDIKGEKVMEWRKSPPANGSFTAAELPKN